MCKCLKGRFSPPLPPSSQCIANEVRSLQEEIHPVLKPGRFGGEKEQVEEQHVVSQGREEEEMTLN